MDREPVNEPEPVSELDSTREPASAGQSEAERLRREVAELERANRELRRTNLRLARERIEALDSAAASNLHRRAGLRPSPARRASSRIKSGLRSLALRILR
jgi:hypothetical protein